MTTILIPVSTFCDWCKQSGMRLHGWQIRFPNSPAIAQITLSSSKFCLSLIGECFRTLWNETSLQSFNVFYDSIKCNHKHQGPNE